MYLNKIIPVTLLNDEKPKENCKPSINNMLKIFNFAASYW